MGSDQPNQEASAPPTGSPPLPPTPQGNCDNCGAPLYGKYCYACGQPTSGMVRHFSSVVSDAADSILNIDERLFRTLVPLYLQPGKLTLDYFAGRRARYVTPFRLVFFLAIVAFFAIQLTVRAGFEQPVGEVRVEASPDGKVSVKPVTGPVDEDTRFSDGNIRFNDRVMWNRQTRPLRVGWLPAVANEWLNDLVGNAQQQLHAMNSGTPDEQRQARNRFKLGMFSAAPTVLFVLLPLFALMLKIFYIFKKRLYMEHLIVAMHSHAFLMLSMLVLVAIGLLRQLPAAHGGWLAWPVGLLYTAAWIWLLAYLWLMQKRVYRQGWFMTTFKYCWIGFFYSILMGFGFVFAVLLSLATG